MSLRVRYLMLNPHCVDYGGYKIDISFPLMMGVCKINSFVWAYRDGGKEPSQLSEGKSLCHA